jgi:hypothetical protein
VKRGGSAVDAVEWPGVVGEYCQGGDLFHGGSALAKVSLSSVNSMHYLVCINNQDRSIYCGNLTGMQKNN